MTDFLTSLVQRQLGEIPVAQPRQPSLYAMSPGMPDLTMSLQPDETEVTVTPEADLGSESQHRAVHNRRPAAPRTMASADRDREISETPDVQRLRPPGPEPLTGAGDVSFEPPVRGRHDEDAPPTRVASRSDERRDRLSRIDGGIESMAPVREFGQGVQQDPPPAMDFRSRGNRFQTDDTTPAPRLVEPRDDRPRSHTAAAPPSLVTSVQPHGTTEIRSRHKSEPPIQVTIGSIEVTAMTAAPAPKRKTAARQPSMSLQDYLGRRQGKGVSS
jgi:hypothetical protein